MVPSTGEGEQGEGFKARRATPPLHALQEMLHVPQLGPGGLAIEEPPTLSVARGLLSNVVKLERQPLELALMVLLIFRFCGS